MSSPGSGGSSGLPARATPLPDLSSSTYKNNMIGFFPGSNGLFLVKIDPIYVKIDPFYVKIDQKCTKMMPLRLLCDFHHIIRVFKYKARDMHRSICRQKWCILVKIRVQTASYSPLSGPPGPGPLPPVPPRS